MLENTIDDTADRRLAPVACSAVLFLDIDGVLNRCGMSGNGLETDKCELLRQIVAATGCNLVISSTWRKFEHLMPRLVRMAHDIGTEIIGITPIMNDSPRCVEIERWLHDHPGHEKFVILDDDYDAGSSRATRPHFVQTHSFHGLQPEQASEVIRRLNDQSLARRASGSE